MKRPRTIKIEIVHTVRKHNNISESVDQISEITDNIYLSSAHAANNYEELQSRGITHVLIIGIIGTQEIECAFSDKIVYKNIAIKDSEFVNISDYFAETTEWMSNILAVNTNKILVHCAKGISRSPTIVIAYLMYTQKLSFDDAYTIVQTRRPCVYPNAGFICQLIDYGKLCSNTVECNSVYSTSFSSDGSSSLDSLDSLDSLASLDNSIGSVDESTRSTESPDITCQKNMLNSD